MIVEFALDAGAVCLPDANDGTQHMRFLDVWRRHGVLAVDDKLGLAKQIKLLPVPNFGSSGRSRLAASAYLTWSVRTTTGFVTSEMLKMRWGTQKRQALR